MKVKIKEYPLVSVILPTYDRPVTLEQAIDSVLEQDYPLLEVIVVDDNNPGTAGRLETERLMHENYQTIKQVIYIKHAENKNGAVARNTGLIQAKGKYICFLDDDDYFLPDKIKRQVDFLNNHLEYDAVSCGINVEGDIYHPIHQGQLTKELLMMEYFPYTSSLMFRVEVIRKLNGFDESFIRHQDFELMLRFFKDHQVSFVDEILLYKGDSMNKNKLKGKEFEELKTYFLSTFEETILTLDHEIPGSKNKIYTSHNMELFLTDLINKDFKHAFVIFLKGLFSYPFTFTIFLFNRFVNYLHRKLFAQTKD